MQSSISYRNCLILVDSFQLAHNTSWIPRYTLMREDKCESLNHDRLDKVFWTKIDADEFALKDAKQWIDELTIVGL